MPKSMTTGSASSMSTLVGLRSRCTTPAEWIASRASARPTPRRLSSARSRGPPSKTRCSRERPGMYRVTKYGRGPSRSASSTGATRGCSMRCSEVNSRRNRARAPSSAAMCAGSSLSATARPAGSVARCTTPIPPAPNCCRNVYRPSASTGWVAHVEPVEVPLIPPPVTCRTVCRVVSFRRVRTNTRSCANVRAPRAVPDHAAGRRTRSHAHSRRRPLGATRAHFDSRMSEATLPFRLTAAARSAPFAAERSRLTWNR